MSDAPLPPDLARVQRALGDGYAVRRLVGEGGFASVYEATDLRLRRPVAVKVLRAELDAPAFRARFRREAEAVARLRHPHVVPVFAVGGAGGPDDLAWFTMPLVDGESLRRVLEREGRLPVGEARRILLEAADALAAAHRLGIVHRDVKPDNVMLEGPERRVVVMDFGIAKALAGDDAEADAEAEDDALRTASGVLLGTPQYMSPEQAGGGGPVDHRADLYALGVVGYQMLAGEPPFRAASVRALLARHVTEPAPPLSARRPECPPDLAAAIARCLEKLPEDRFATADDLRRALAGAGSAPPAAPAAAAPPDAAPAPTPVGAFRRALAAGAGASALALAVDLPDGRVHFAPLVLLVAAAAVAAAYGRLWVAGFAWRDVLGRAGAAPAPGDRRGATPTHPLPTGARPSPTHGPDDSGDVRAAGPHGALLQRARRERAAALAALNDLARAERAPLDDLPGALDAALGRAAELARQLAGMDARLDPAERADLDARLAAARAEPPSAAREARLAGLGRQRASYAELLGRRDAAAARLEALVDALERLRLALERARRGGVRAALGEIAALRARLSDRD